MSSRLFFVNKFQSSQDLSRSSPSESAVMLSHVQRNRRKVEGKHKQQSWSAFISVLPPLEGKRTSKGTATAKVVPNLQPPPQAAPLPSMYPTFNSFDPFHCTVVGLDVGTHNLLHYAFADVHWSNFLAESFAPNPKARVELTRRAAIRVGKFLEARLQRCVEDKLLMYATLAYGSGFLGWNTGQFRFSGKPPEYFLSKAIPAVRRRIADKRSPIDGWLLLSIYSLAVTEMWNGLPQMWATYPERRAMASQTATQCRDASRMHMQAMQHLVSEAGGWDRFDPYILDSIILADKYLAIASAQPPILTVNWDPGPLPAGSEGACTDDDEVLHRLGSRLMGEPLAAELRRTLEDLVDHFRASHKTWLRTSIEPNLESWLYRRSQAIMYRLLIHSHDRTLPSRDRSTSLAALIFVFMSIPLEGPQASAKNLASLLHATLRETQLLSDNDISRDLRTWCLCMGGLIPGPFEEHEWFIRQIWLQRAEYGSDKALVTVLESYLYFGPRQSRLLESMLCML